ncbi:Calmodulin binding protein-like protein [Cynara cardunculus var. scolymus]|uniref:Calmodulin binding protein-like protein n=1 Tax=Cynara cardunculus var. scolymus TaxID=59895 RepID=A0A103YBZ5_CYNCS|nr:Calmodulin binding protein-like protein [Cynara cardunculus var. scolymus]
MTEFWLRLRHHCSPPDTDAPKPVSLQFTIFHYYLALLFEFFPQGNSHHHHQRIMSQKKTSPPPEQPSSSSSSASGRRKRPSFRNVVIEAMRYAKFNKYVEPILEPLVRRVNEKDSYVPRRLQLQFLSSLSLPVFTGTRIEGGDCNTLKVALIDASTGKTVSSGIESSATVEIVVLEGDFDSNEGDNWTLEEFNNNIVRERQGKKALLTGNALLNLQEGFGLVGDLSFSDNSSWTRSRKFRLGARVLDNCNGDRVREAKSESFVVRDHRVYKKHHPPYLSDEVWRLEKIGKEGAFHKRLNKEKIKTVKDFLVLSYVDPARLRNILGSGMSTKMWEVTMEHARRCVIDDMKLYLYCPRSLNRDGVVFNVVGQVLGLLSDSKYIVADKLSETELAEAHKLVISSFQHQEEIICYDDEASLKTGTCSISEDIYPTNALTVAGDSECNKTIASHTKGRFDYPQMSAPSPDVMPSIMYPPMGDIGSLDEYGLNSMESDDLRFDQPVDLHCQVSDTLICDSESLKSQDVDMQYFGTSSEADLQCAVDGFLFPHSAIVKAQRRWKIVSSVLKWLSLMLEIRERDIIKTMN